KQYFIELHKNFCSGIELENFSPKVQAATQNFLNSSRFEELKEIVYKNDNFIVEPGGYGESRLGNLKIYAKMDCLYQDQDKLTIIDWKTGKERSEEHNNQLLAYCAAAQNCLEIPPARIEAVAAYTFPSYKEKMLTPSPDRIEDFTHKIGQQTEEMYAYCKDIPNNIPLPKENFPKLNHGAFCKHCNFEELCT
nr:PD-(D/E)XK nuclease family protein [Deltaproteobacteria bacterium]